MAKNEVEQLVKKYNDILDINFINQIINNSPKMGDFEMNKSTLMNIGEWALNGSSDDEIRKKLDLSPEQWGILLSICPTMLLVMRESRAMADIVIAGSLYQTAIGGKRIKRQVAKTVRDFDENGKVIGEHLEKIELEEELPPNPVLLKFLAENKLSEKFGESKVDNSGKYKDFIEKLTPEERAVIEMASRENN